MSWAQTQDDNNPARPTHGLVARVLTYSAATLAFLNCLYFVLRGTNPVMMADDWYFLDVFLRKAIDGTLGFADLFVKRLGPDHAQPLFKVVLLAEWRYLGLDLTLGAVLGVFAAAGCALVYLRLVAPRVKRADPVRYVVWAAICALLFSLNGGSASQWTWPLNALLNITNLIILLFLLVVWHAHATRRYVLLTVATLFLGFSSDDQAIVTAIAAILALLLMRRADPNQRSEASWKSALVILICMVVVRIGYLFTPRIGGAVSSQTFSHEVVLLIDRFSNQGWWMWVVYPLTVPVSIESPFRSVGATAWFAIVVLIGLILVAAHVWFWIKAFRCRYNRTTFVAVATMLVAYGWIGGIILFRVGHLGNEDVQVPRYIVLYTGSLIALLLMWIATREKAPQRHAGKLQAVVRSLPVIGCMALVLVQIPISISTWRTRPYLHIYYATMADQIGALTADPERHMDCVPVLPVCDWPANKRAELTRMLSQNELNVFSPQVQKLHRYLPRLGPVSPISSNTDGEKSVR